MQWVSVSSGPWRVVWFVSAFLWALAVSSAYAQTTYYAGQCSSFSNVVSVNATAECRVDNVSTGTGQCLYTARRGSPGSWQFYACGFLGNWGDFDVDQDGVSNGVDFAPYDASVGVPPGLLPSNEIDVAVSGVLSDAQSVFAAALGVLASVIGFYIAFVFFRKATGKASS